MYTIDPRKTYEIKSAVKKKLDEGDEFAPQLLSRLATLDSKVTMTEQNLERRAQSVIDDMQGLIDRGLVRGDYSVNESRMDSVTQLSQRLQSEANERVEMYRLAAHYAGLEF